MTTRSRKSQSKHNGKVKKLAKDYKKRGYNVKADIEGCGQPETIGGLRPDLLASKDGNETVVEVETQDSKDSARDLKQQKTFKQWSQKNQKRRYRRVLTKE